jgi:lysophospholipase L1-like esterase
MKIHCFGDSWTQGVGVEWEPGRGQIPMSDRYDLNWDNERKLYAWPGQLNTLLKSKYKVNNFGAAGYSNFEIYREVMHRLHEGHLKKGDLVIVCFSSIIREPLNFLDTANYEANGFINYSNECHIRPSAVLNLNWIDQIENDEMRDGVVKLYKDFIVNRFSYEFLHEIAMNYVCNLQILLESLDIDYLFLNAFENILCKKVSFYEQVKLKNWILPNYTLSEYLLDRKDEINPSLPYALWEDDHKVVRECSDGPHPNRIGYGFIAELIHSEIVKRKLLKDVSVI